MKKVLILIVGILLMSCSSQKEVRFNEDIIDCIVEESPSLPSQFLNYNFFCKNSNNQILMLGVYDLRDIYKKKYSWMSYKDFLTEALNQRLLIAHNSFITFDLDKTVEREYRNNKLEDFIKIYCDEYRRDFYNLKPVDKYLENTILYYLFINNYLSSFDDYSGVYGIAGIHNWQCK